MSVWTISLQIKAKPGQQAELSRKVRMLPLLHVDHTQPKIIIQGKFSGICPQEVYLKHGTYLCQLILANLVTFSLKLALAKINCKGS